MTYYIRTDATSFEVKTLTKYFLRINAENMFKTLKNSTLNEFIKKEYKLTIKEIFDKYIQNIEVDRINSRVVEITNNKFTRIKQYSLQSLLNLLEDGNSEIAPPRLMSTLLNNSLTAVEDQLEGV